MKRTFLALALACLVSFVASGRTWTDTQGKTIEGDFIRMEDDSHVIVRKDGKEMNLEVAQLGDADRQWLEGHGVVLGKLPSTTALTRAIRIEDLGAAQQNITPELVNQPDLGGYHPLTYAAYTGKHGLVEALLKGGADPNVVEQDGTTALFVAALLDQADMIRTLKKHGAKYPARELRRQPAAAAVRSEGLASLRVLYELYPDLDSNAGWPWPKEFWGEKLVRSGDYLHPYYARSALLFATYAGYDGIARELLAHGADVQLRTSMGVGALHRAAANPRISTEVVAALLSRGEDPFFGSFAPHFSPRSPLDLAAASGSMEKVRLLTKGQDPQQHVAAYRWAALQASAAGKRDIMNFLFRELGEATPKLEQLTARITPARQAGSEDHQTMAPLDLMDEPLPAIRPDAKDKPAAPGSVAVIASRSLDNHVALLTGELSSIEGLTLLERDQLGDVASEKLLQKLSGQNHSAEGLDLGLVPADQLVFLQEIKVSERRFIRVMLLSVATRATMFRQVLEYAEPDQSWVKSRLAPLLDAVRHGKDASELKTTAVSLIPLTPVNRTPECLQLVRHANLVLPGRVLREPGVTLLTLRQMQPLESENALAGQDSYWKAAWVIEGSLSTDSVGEVSLILSASPPGQARHEDVTVRGQSRDLTSLTGRAWQELAAKLELKATDSPVFAGIPQASPDEAKAVAQQARWFLEAKYPRDAFDLANASYVLGYREQELLRTMTEAAIDRLSVQQKYGCDHVRRDPRVIDPAVRLSYASVLPEFLALCDCARLYVSMLNGKLVSQGQSPVYNSIVAHALGELQFYRLMMEDCLAEDRYGREFRQLDEEINSLTREYLKRCRGHASEMDTLRGLLARRPGGVFYERHAPQLLQEIFSRIIEVAEQTPTHSDFPHLLDWLDDRCGNPEQPCGPDDPYYVFAVKLAGIDGVVKAWPREAAQVRAACATERAPRIQALRQVLAISTDPARAKFPLHNSRREWVRFFDCKEDPESTDLLYHGHLLGVGGIGSLITKPSGDFTGTGEFARMAAWYHDLLRWSRMDVSAREKLILARIDHAAGQSGEERVRPALIAELRDYLREGGVLTPKVAEALAKIVPDQSTPGSSPANDGSLALVHLLTLPEAEGMAQFARATQASLDRDQLWLPATYYEAGGDVRNAQTPPRCHHVIHVIRLADKTVRTIELPKEKELDSEWAEPTRIAPIDPSGVRPVLLGEKHAYFLKCSRPGRLYSIDRHTLEVSAVDLPLPHVIAMGYRTRGDLLYLSLADRSALDLGRGRVGDNSVVAVSGDKVIATLVSNQRKPAQTPLDHPHTWVDRIEVGEQRLVLISGKEAGYLDPELSKGAALPWNSEAWVSLNVREVGKVNNEWHKAYTELFLTHRNLSEGGNKVVITEDPYDGEVPAAITLAKDANAAMDFLAASLTQPSKSGQFRTVPVLATPVEDPQMNRKMFALRVPPGQRKAGERYRFPTANELIKEGNYNVRVLGKWRDLYLVFLAGEKTVTMPAIWMVPDAKLRERVSKLPPW